MRNALFRTGNFGNKYRLKPEPTSSIGGEYSRSSPSVVSALVCSHMAVSLPNHSLLSPRALSTTTSSSSPFKPPLLLRSSAPLLVSPGPLLRPRNHCLGFSARSLRPVKFSHSPTVRRLWSPLATTVDSAGSNVDGEHNQETPHNEEDLVDSFSVSELVEAYKQAVVSGDDKRLFDIEGKICNLVVERQELDSSASSLSAEITSGKEKYIRLQADFDNFRKSSNKQVLTVMSEAQREAIANLLPMVDKFETARKQIKPETEKERKIDTSYQGIYKQFVEVLRSLHVSAVATVGKPFDPSLHEAIAREESEELKAGIIIQELRRGFLLKNRVLRAAKVKVSLGPGGKKLNASQDEPYIQRATTTASADDK